MNILFLTLFDFKSFNDQNIYCDLLRNLIGKGHDVYCISPTDKRNNVPTHFEENNRLLKLKIGNIQKTNIIEKGISTLLVEPQFKAAIKKYFSSQKFDLVLYSTPPITLLGAIKYVKQRDNAKTYLILKDIFPQNAVDLNMLKKTGIKGLIYRYFRSKEKKLYAVSDKIGCMSPANIDYVVRHNPHINPERVELCPNSIEICDKSISEEERARVREKYGIPQDKTVFAYGGNIGKPQGIDFVMDCINLLKDNEKAYFLIVGNGTEYKRFESFIGEINPGNVKLLQFIPKSDYDLLISACDVGMVFLDYNFTIPNFPSRILSYLQAKLAVIAATDRVSDIGSVITQNNCGFACFSNDSAAFCDIIRKCCETDLKPLGENGFELLKREYDVGLFADRIAGENSENSSC